MVSTNFTRAINTPVIQKFTASGTYTPTSGMIFCIIECVGGGGAGGAGSAGLVIITEYCTQ